MKSASENASCRAETRNQKDSLGCSRTTRLGRDLCRPRSLTDCAANTERCQAAQLWLVAPHPAVVPP
ncbi:hypothetical protein NDU88_004095 [Pleurodeles waltl]|uniref:Uncharacterized protein n=1 Tax=Pleurodeles waltl TaxID=8319 RepID=A0AAV7V097_PLEWA|nr:hypothetical protein NDU88_004095 [Pleurodeles waltl]